MSREVLLLKAQLKERDEEIAALKHKLAQLEKNHNSVQELYDRVTPLTPLTAKTALSNEDIMRYSRQLLVPQLAVQGQLNLSKTSVLVVGCGGLGCPLALYLAAAGIGRLGLLDYDEVELNNLHRQVLHGEENQGQAKALSAAQALKSSTHVFLQFFVLFNTHCLFTTTTGRYFSAGLLDFASLIYDIVADCSDNVPTRYLVNDACVLSGKPLVSASALRLEGQLTVYNYHGGPCYRCLYPVPPPPETVTNCSDGGVLGVASCSQKLLMFDAQDAKFRSIKLRPKKADCAVCGEEPSVTQLVDYETFCGSAASDKCRRLNLLSRDQRITVQEYKSILDKAEPHLLLDVRPLVEVDICRLPFSLKERKLEDVQLLKRRIDQLRQGRSGDFQPPVYVICKLGNDSQKAVQVMEKMSGSEVDAVTVKDICGGLMAWAKTIDSTFPQY
ncbi:Adenylyltransferase and sulfurtransferase MOCS3 [Takifugu flavidus]|uniref:Adenylyltransferase and sulfurtransferase MOCS3 n=1 Tax=Takifugu flavidus TaxID=433684 RepID=A0A5C6P0D4_9TELE|nr:Adenylyltransferase and sulfurtransferase MOCS3 [Takifugu flavidus]